MSRNDMTSAIIDGVLRVVALGGVTAIALITPNALQLVDKPLARMLRKMDQAAQEREVRRVLVYMRRQGLVHQTADEYEHGLTLTAAGKQRLEQSDYDRLNIPRPERWDHKWRLVFFDVPEEKHVTRKRLTQKLRLLEFQQLQMSIWIHPFPCRPEIEAVANRLGVQRYITYVEISQIDNQQKLITRFSNLLKT